MRSRFSTEIVMLGGCRRSQRETKDVSGQFVSRAQCSQQSSLTTGTQPTGLAAATLPPATAHWTSQAHGPGAQMQANGAHPAQHPRLRLVPLPSHWIWIMTG